MQLADDWSNVVIKDNVFVTKPMQNYASLTYDRMVSYRRGKQSFLMFKSFEKLHDYHLDRAIEELKYRDSLN